MSIAVNLDVEAAGWRSVPDVESLVARSIEQASRRCGRQTADQTDLSVLLCDDATIRDLNKSWRGKDKATNVLSFPAPGPLNIRPMLGDIAVAWETTALEAAEEHKPVSNHLAHLVVHGFLHLVGFDHETESEAAAMEALETGILAELGVPDPYLGSEPDEKAPE